RAGSRAAARPSVTWPPPRRLLWHPAAARRKRSRCVRPWRRPTTIARGILAAPADGRRQRAGGVERAPSALPWAGARGAQLLLGMAHGRARAAADRGPARCRGRADRVRGALGMARLARAAAPRHQLDL